MKAGQLKNPGNHNILILEKNILACWEAALPYSLDINTFTT